MVLYAAGRVGATSDLGLENCGLTADSRGRITVNRDTFQTKKTNIYAVGDVVGFPALASTSMAQGRIAACHAFGEEIFKPSEFILMEFIQFPKYLLVECLKRMQKNQE